MEITDVRIRKVTGGGKLKAFVSITFDDIFVVHDLKIIEGEKGVFVAMPSRKTPGGEFRDTAHPIKTEGRRMIQDAVLNKYKEMFPGELSSDHRDSGKIDREAGPGEPSPVSDAPRYPHDGGEEKPRLSGRSSSMDDCAETPAGRDRQPPDDAGDNGDSPF